jgi:recombination protein RecT
MAENNALSPVAIKLKTLRDQLEKASGAMSAVAARMVTADKLIKIAVAAAQRTPLLLDCSPQSIVRSVIQGAELGLTPGSALNQAYLVPFKNKKTNGYEAQLIVSAQGLSELAYRSGLISFISSEVVYADDEFEYELGLDPKLRHVPTGIDEDPAKITHAYMVVGLKDGSRVFRVMTRKAIDRIRSRSQARDAGPWVTDYAEMARKTVIKNGMKYVPKSIEVARAVQLDNAVESGDWTDIEFDAPEALSGLEAMPLAEGTSKKVAKAITANTDGIGLDYDPNADEELPYTGPTVREDD